MAGRSLSRATIDAAVDAAGLRPVHPLAERVYKAITRYAFDEGVCFPSQALIAQDVGIARPTVNAMVRELREAGWLRIIERRWSPRSRWLYNTYELLADYVVDRTAARWITARAHRAKRRWTAAKTAARGRDDTNGVKTKSTRARTRVHDRTRTYSHRHDRNRLR